MIDSYKGKVQNASSETRFFRRETKDVYGETLLGKHFFYQLPRKIARFLEVPNADSFTGHSMRRTAATWLANEGFTTMEMQKFGQWKSATVAEGYVENSVTARLEYANAISNESVSLRVRKTEKSCESRFMFANCVFNQPNFGMNRESTVKKD